MQCSGCVIAPNYATGCMAALLCNENSKEIYLNTNKFLHYRNEEAKVFQEQSIDMQNLPKQQLKVIECIEDYSCKQQIVRSLSEVIEICKNYKYIVSNDLQSFIASNLRCSYFEENKYIDSFEGAWFAKIFALCAEPYSIDLIKQIALFQNRLIDSSFPYAQFSPLANDEFVKRVQEYVHANEFVKLYEFLTKKTPIWNPKKQDMQFLNEAMFIKKNIGEHYLIDKSLAQFVHEDVVYIGCKPTKGVTLQIIYEPNFQKHEPWPSQEIAYHINSEYEKSLENAGNIGKLKSLNLKVPMNMENLYADIKNFAIAEIRARQTKQPIANEWKYYLKSSGIEYIKILQKAEKLIENFMQWHQEDGEWQGSVFYGATRVAYLKWQTPTKGEIYSNMKIKKIIEENDLKEFAVISCTKILNVELDSAFKEVVKSRQKCAEDDLFYWSYETF